MAIVIKEKKVYVFALRTFEELVKKGYSIALTPSKSGSDLFIISSSPFGNRSVFRTRNLSGYDKGPINISGSDYYMSNDWYEDKSKGALCIDNLNKYVSQITSGAYRISKDSEGNFQLEMLIVGSSTPSISIPIATPPAAPLVIHLRGKSLECKELLEANHNIILSGAPGTGKTYMAKQIALAMTGSEDRIGFVQFHPSYDYTDFVEGLRPTSASGSTIGFERNDGIFKEFCEKALLDSNNNYLFIIDEINRGEMSKVFGELFFSIDPGYRGKSGAVRTQYANMVTKPNTFDSVLGKTNPKDFGYFFVPENVYIIGTMNDIDRSVDSMDFAMRRRFLIKDIKAEDTQKDMLTDEAVIAKMDALNKVIEGKSEKKIKAKLGSSYSLGASYFQKYYKYNDFDKLWEYHLEGILREYLRGTQDPDNDLKVLKDAFENA